MSGCGACGAVSGLRCSGCQQTHYCSKVCQKKDWKIHKYLCKTFEDFQDPPPSDAINEGFIRAIYFHPEEIGPRFVWLKHIKRSSHMAPQECGLLSNSEEEARSNRNIMPQLKWVNKDSATGLRLPHVITLRFREAFLLDGSKPNKAIHKISDTTSPYLYNWKGPLYAYGTDQFENIAVGLMPSDLRHIKDYFNNCTHSSETDELSEGLLHLSLLMSMERNENEGQQEQMVKAIRINCTGDVEVKKRPQLKSIQIPIIHNIFKAWPTPISSRIELPISVMKIYGSERKWKERESRNGPGDHMRTNQVVTALTIGCEPGINDLPLGYGWGSTPLGWDKSVGSVIVARTDKKPLLVEHIAALTEYCHVKLRNDFRTQKEDGLDKEYVLQEITKPKFEAYYTAWKARQGTERARSQVSPYEV